MENKDGYKLVISGRDNRSDDNYDIEQLEKGIEVEKEHTNQIDLAKMIAKDHLDEFPTYYTELTKMEQSLSSDKNILKPEDLDNIL